MSGATFEFELKSNRKEVLRGSEEAVERGLAAIGMRAVTYTHRPKERGGTPVDTGRLRNSIAWATASQGGGGTDAPLGGGADDRVVEIQVSAGNGDAERTHDHIHGHQHGSDRQPLGGMLFPQLCFARHDVFAPL